MGKKDNSVFRQKTTLRRAMLKHLQSPPIILETHGGTGHLFRECYSHVAEGVVFETNPQKSAVLARQRPGWAVYETDCVMALAGGVGGHLVVNILDVDPYGEPWPVIDAFFASQRPRSPDLWVVVNDGLRQKIRMGAWAVHSMAEMVEKYGNALAGNYLDICQELLQTKAIQAGYRLDRFAGYYCGHAEQMTHYLAGFTRLPTDAPALARGG